jgi:hypothetical protein
MGSVSRSPLLMFTWMEIYKNEREEDLMEQMYSI